MQNLQLRQPTEKLHFISMRKPAGISTHRPMGNVPGFQDWIESVNHQKLWTVHRLDRDTSGLLIFALENQTSRDLSKLFEHHQVQKKYFLRTARSQMANEFEVSSFIEKQDKTYVSRTDITANATTRFQKISETHDGDLWQASPLSGKTHQIRLHAAQMKIPILGDRLYGGKTFYRLCLHASEMRMQFHQEDLHLKVKNPAWYDLKNETDHLFLLLQDAWIDCEGLWQFPPDFCFRFISGEKYPFEIDRYGKNFWVYWRAESDPSKEWVRAFEKFADFNQHGLILQKMENRQKQKTFFVVDKIAEPHWQVEENGLKFQIQKNQGESAGLFLDQRKNREFVLKNSSDKKVLNLFAYTCGLSVAAAKGGAKEVVSVDFSKASLKWGKENFVINDLDPSKYEFWDQDVLLFLKGCAKRNRKFDLIICDPPVVGRSKEGLFRLEKQFLNLLELCWNCLEDYGDILFTTHLQDFTKQYPIPVVQQFLKTKSLILKAPPPPEELSLSSMAGYSPRLLHGFLLRKQK